MSHVSPLPFCTAALLHSHVSTHTGTQGWKILCYILPSKLDEQANGSALELCSVIILCSEISDFLWHSSLRRHGL